MIGLEEERGQLDRRLRILLTQALEEIRGFEKFRWQLLVTLHVGGVKKKQEGCVAFVWAQDPKLCR